MLFSDCDDLMRVLLWSCRCDFVSLLMIPAAGSKLQPVEWGEESDRKKGTERWDGPGTAGLPSWANPISRGR